MLTDQIFDNTLTRLAKSYRQALWTPCIGPDSPELSKFRIVASFNVCCTIFQWKIGKYWG